MKLVVKNSYVVFHKNLRWKGGEVIPPEFHEAVMNTQHWKVEDNDVKKESKVSSSRGTEETEERKEGKEKIKDIVTDRSMKEEKVKTK